MADDIEGRAREWIDTNIQFCPEHTADRLRRALADLIREAVLAEREACARVPESRARQCAAVSSWMSDVTHPHLRSGLLAREKVYREIAAAIRSRGEVDG